VPSFPGAHRPNRRASDEIASVRLLGAFGGQALDIGKHHGVKRDLSGGPDRESEPLDEPAETSRSFGTSLTVWERRAERTIGEDKG
jgi:hypothetical protein